MGNDIKNIGGKIGHILIDHDKPTVTTPQGVPLNKQQNVLDIANLNKLLLKNIVNLGSKLQLQTDSISKNGQKWENSLVRGKISVEVQIKQKKDLESSIFSQKQKNQGNNNKVQESQPIKMEENQHTHKIKSEPQIDKVQSMQSSNHSNNQQATQKNQENKSKSLKKVSSFTIILTLLQLYEIKRLLQNYFHQQSELSQKRKSSEGKLCVICLDNKPEQVLPCAHSYCKKCMEMYVISKDRKCPMCRKSYRESLAENIYQIVQWDEDFILQMRNIFYNIIEKNNPKQAKKIRRLVAYADRQK